MTIPTSIEKRALDLIESNPAMDILDAVKKAIEEENSLIEEIISGATDRVKLYKHNLIKRVYISKVIKQ